MAKRESGKNGLLTPVEEVRLAKAIAAGDKTAREKLILANNRLVVSIANKHREWNVPLNDLVQEGIIGLIHAVDKFNYRRGNKFSTYATWWIRQYIYKAIAEQSRAIRLPPKIHERALKIYQAESMLTQILDRQPTNKELAKKLNLRPQQIDRAKIVFQGLISLDQPIIDNDGITTIEESISSQNPKLDPESVATNNLVQEIFKSILETMSPREERVLKLRFGFVDGQSHTLDEIGKKFGVTRERIRQIEAKAIRKLRHPSRSRILKDFYS